jgi:hypothetical protein
VRLKFNCVSCVHDASIARQKQKTSASQKKFSRRENNKKQENI